MVSQNTSSYNNVYRFSGKELDEETGLSYFGARYYNPKWSVWLSVDPLAESFPNWNPYNYTMQNPINLVDPTGMSSESPDNGYNGIWNSQTKRYDYTQVNDIGGDKTDVVKYSGGHLDGRIIGFSVRVERVYYSDMHSKLPHTYESERSPGYQQLLKNTFNGHAIQPVGGLFDIFGFKEVGAVAIAEASGSSYAPLALAILTKGKASTALGAANGGMTAFETAIAGGKHSGFLKNYIGRSTDEMNKTIDLSI